MLRQLRASALKSLYLRIYITLVALLLTFAFGSAWLFKRQIEEERGGFEAAAVERLNATAVLIQGALPPADAPASAQAESLRDWGQRLRMAIALSDTQGRRIGQSEQFERREADPSVRRLDVPLDDGRTLSFLRGARMQRGPGPQGPHGPQGPGTSVPGMGPIGPMGEPRLRPPPDSVWPLWGPLGALRGPSGEALAVFLVLLFLGVAAGAYPVVRRLTRRLENLQRGVEQFGAGNLGYRVHDEGRDEVAKLAASFNRSAQQIETLLRSHQSLLANASHELRSPLARLKMAFSMLEEASATQRERLQREINTNIAELDALVEEVLLASRLEAGGQTPVPEPVDMLGLAVEEAARSGAGLSSELPPAQCQLLGEERLLRRALRNLLENARRYGGGAEVLLELRRQGERLELRVNDRGPGVPPEMRERIFEPFFRLPGHAEQAGGVGLGLSLVKQIAERHQGRVRCEAREGGGSCFVLSLPGAGGR
ncbi:HAMP domain-containing sensor histidine kinase [Kinneretia asaccharophila]|uniref:histidine kinase n=1 Tax=Roseateles asaccharophilus TaxID=582607 RepID=A0A4R6NA73_9BURK|nr:HAMP domain-containing sensor histidine kinase [Roseateles asaccharophilus]MDN3543422.1 HAMP domain-containing sensor histidine kinase [Roseateles asaccharophilus]TDP12200.1 signal transduction histidine kinase [Roseateles asaccharophilus]